MTSRSPMDGSPAGIRYRNGSRWASVDRDIVSCRQSGLRLTIGTNEGQTIYHLPQRFYSVLNVIRLRFAAWNYCEYAEVPNFMAAVSLEI